MKLYHYTPRYKFEKYISVSNLLRFTDPFGGNCNNKDPEEYFYPKEKIMAFVIERIDANTNNRFLKEFRNYCIKNFDNPNVIEKIERKLKDLRFLSCSKNPENIHLIKEFAKGDGYRIELDLDLLKYVTNNMFYVSDVVYINDGHEVDLNGIYADLISLFLTKLYELKKSCNIDDNNINYNDDEKYVNVLAYLSAFIKTRNDNHEREEETRILLDFGMLYGSGEVFKPDENSGELPMISIDKNNFLYLNRNERKAYEYAMSNNKRLIECACNILMGEKEILPSKISKYYKTIGIYKDESYIRERLLDEFIYYCGFFEPDKRIGQSFNPGQFYLSLSDLNMKWRHFEL